MPSEAEFMRLARLECIFGATVKLKRSLLICRSAGLYIERKGGEREVILDSSIFPTVMISSRRDWKADPKNARCYVQFNPLVTASIEVLTFRQFDYETLMS